MIPIRGLVVCVGYDDLLALTLWPNMRHLAECVVVTSPDDERTGGVARGVPGVRVFETDAFTRPDADGVRPRFNKGLAAEEALDWMGREGWVLSWDADTIFPDSPPFDLVRPGRLHGMHRVVLEDARRYAGPESWGLARPQKDDPGVGYFQLFHADDPAVRGSRPWFEPTFAHAGGCDEFLAQHWPPARRVMLPATCLHLGPVATNWYGRASARLDGQEGADAAENLRAMDALIKRFDWHWARPGLDMAALEDDGTTPHRLAIPGCGPTGFEIPFAASAPSRRAGRRGGRG